MMDFASATQLPIPPNNDLSEIYDSGTSLYNHGGGRMESTDTRVFRMDSVDVTEASPPPPKGKKASNWLSKTFGKEK